MNCRYILILAVALLSTVTAHNIAVYEIAPISNELLFDIKPNEETGNIVEALQSTSANPEELGNYFEGDIMLEPGETTRQALEGVKMWDGGVVPFIIDHSFSFTGLNIIHWAMRKFHQKTCIRFRPKTKDDRDFISLSNNKTGCWSHIGRMGGLQPLNLQEPGCLHWGRRGTAVHELMHALGISHEHNRPDRDHFVHILYQNVRDNRSYNFQKNKHFLNQVMPYDYGSLMHYSMFAFSKNGRKFTLRPKITDWLKKRKEYSFEMGQRFRMSQLDIMRLNALYCHSKRKGLVFSIWNAVTDGMFPVQM